MQKIKEINGSLINDIQNEILSKPLNYQIKKTDKIALFTYHKSSGIINWGNLWSDILGYGSFDYKYVSFSIFEEKAYPGDYDVLLDNLKDLNCGRLTELNFEYRLKSKIEQYIWFLTIAKPSSWDDKGNVIEYSGVTININDKKQVDSSKFIDSELLTKLTSEYLLNSIDEGILVIDTDMIINYCNNYILKILRKSKEQLIGEKCYKAFSIDLPCDDCIVIPAMREQQTKKSETLINSQWFARKAYPLYNEKNEVIGGIEVWQDVSDKKFYEAQLAERKKCIDNTLKVANILEWKYYVKTNILEISSLWDEMIGGEKPSVDNDLTYFEKWLSPIEIEKMKNAFFDLLYNGKNFSEGEIKLKKNIKDTEWLKIKGRVEERDSFFMPKVISGICEDITEKKKADLKEKNITEKFNRILGIAEIGLWEYDIITSRLIINDTMKNLIGPNITLPNIMTEKILKDFIVEEDYLMLEEQLRKIYANQLDKISLNIRLNQGALKGQRIEIKGIATERDENGRYIKGEGILRKI